MRVVLMGPPGAGKGTQAEKLVEKFGMVHLSSGDIFRAEKASGSQLGKKLSAIMETGALVPDNIVVEMMAGAIAAVKGSGLLLDGFPRTVAQGEALDKTLAELDASLDAVIIITADDDIIVERITGRRTCPSTGKIYHVKNMPPKVDGIDDETGEALVQRDDDKEDVVRRRLGAYKKQTQPVIEYYRKTGKVKIIEVDGMKSPEDVFDDIAVTL